MSRAPLRHRTVLGACAVLLAALAAPALHQPAVAAPSDASASPTAGPSAGTSTAGTPSDKARRAGITREGLAYLGWENHSTPPESNPKPDRKAGPALAAGLPEGIDVSSHQGNVDWDSWWAAGKTFAYVKATEGTTYKNPYFTQQYNGSYNVGMIRGAYHFALPDRSSGATQAGFLASNGGAWSGDGKTLPAVLDIEYNPYGATCYGKTQSAMRAWIADFLATYKARTTRDAVIYTTTDWWTTCTGNTAQFASTSPLWIARYASTVGTLPSGWAYWTFWQYSSSPIDQNRFNGTYTQLQKLATG